MVSDLITCLEQTPWLWEIMKSAMAEEFAEMGLSGAVTEESEPEDLRLLFVLAIQDDESLRDDITAIATECN